MLVVARSSLIGLLESAALVGQGLAKVLAGAGTFEKSLPEIKTLASIAERVKRLEESGVSSNFEIVEKGLIELVRGAPRMKAHLVALNSGPRPELIGREILETVSIDNYFEGRIVDHLPSHIASTAQEVAARMLIARDQLLGLNSYPVTDYYEYGRFLSSLRQARAIFNVPIDNLSQLPDEELNTGAAGIIMGLGNLRVP